MLTPKLMFQIASIGAAFRKHTRHFSLAQAGEIGSLRDTAAHYFEGDGGAAIA